MNIMNMISKECMNSKGLCSSEFIIANSKVLASKLGMQPEAFESQMDIMRELVEAGDHKDYHFLERHAVAKMGKLTNLYD